MDNMCFACGADNTQGLRLKIIETDNGVTAIIKLQPQFQGYTKIVHGGVVAAILDEMAVWAAFKKGHKSATAELNVRIKKPMIVNDEYNALGRVIKVKHKLVQAEAEIKDKNNESVAKASVKLIKIG